MRRTACRKAASLADLDLGLRVAARPSVPEAEPPRGPEKDPAQTEVEETLAKIASIIRGRQDRVRDQAGFDDVPPLRRPSTKISSR